MVPTDESLLLDLRQGKAAALGAYLERHRPEIMAFLGRITGDHLLGLLTLDDLYQEVAASAWAAFPQVSGANLEPLPWLLQLARRRVSDAYRFHFVAQRRARSQLRSLEHNQADGRMSLEELLVSSITSPSDVVSRNIRLNRVDQALQSLGDEIELIVRMRYVDGLSTQEIAQRLDKSDVSIRVTLSRSIKKLAALLAED